MKAFLRWGLCFLLGGLGTACSSALDEQDQKQAEALETCAAEQQLTPAQQAAMRNEINADEKEQRIAEIVRQKVRAGFNGNVLVAQKGVILYQKSFGLERFERGRRDSLTADSKFQLASLSKTFTAVATLKLIQQGKLSLEDSIQKFYPNFPYRGITVQQLLSHRSGLPNYVYAFDDSMKVNFYKREKPYPTNATIMHWFATVQPTPMRYNVPGRSFVYNNTNYMVLASIIEKASKMPFEQYVRKTIFEPLGMKDTYLATTRDTAALNRHRTAGYQWNRRIPKDYYDDVLGDKGVYSTTGDLFKWYRALNGDCILPQNLLAEAFTPRSFERKGSRNYGYGFRMHLDAKNQPEFIYHTGWWKGYNTMFWFSPKDEYVIIMLANKFNRSVYAVNELVTVLHGRERNLDAESEEVEVAGGSSR